MPSALMLVFAALWPASPAFGGGLRRSCFRFIFAAFGTSWATPYGCARAIVNANSFSSLKKGVIMLDCDMGVLS